MHTWLLKFDKKNCWILFLHWQLKKKQFFVSIFRLLLFSGHIYIQMYMWCSSIHFIYTIESKYLIDKKWYHIFLILRTPLTNEIYPAFYHISNNNVRLRFPFLQTYELFCKTNATKCKFLPLNYSIYAIF